MPNFVPNNFKECDLDLKITLIYMHIFIHNIVRGGDVFTILCCSLGGSIFTEIQVFYNVEMKFISIAV
jgi:hypothetical protein